jgi:hypothetical protein
MGVSASDSKKAFKRAASSRHSGRIEASCPLTAEGCSSVASLALGGMSMSADNAIHVGIGLGGKLMGTWADVAQVSVGNPENSRR